MLHDRIGNPSTGDGSALIRVVNNGVVTTRRHSKRMRWRVVHVHGILMSDELDPSLDVRHLDVYMYA
jgi:hypothetical protein